MGLILGTMFIFSGTISIISILAGIGLACFGILFFRLITWLFVKFNKGIVKYFKWLHKIILGGKHEKDLYYTDNNYANNF